MSRYIATPHVAKHRLFVWCDVRICPDKQLIVIARADDTTFGILHSRFHCASTHGHAAVSSMASSATENAIVIASMNPGIASCWMTS